MSKKTRRGEPGQPRCYETVMVIDSQLSDDVVKSIVEKVKEILTTGEARILKVEEQGKRKLAYPIQKRTYGVYVTIDFEHTGSVIKTLTDHYHITEGILRHLTLIVDSRLRTQRAKAETAPPAETREEALAI